MNRLMGLWVVLFCLCVCAPAQAQNGPSIIERGRADRGPAVPEGAARAPATPTGDVHADTRGFRPFVFQKLEIEGASLPVEAFAQISAPFVGKTLSRDDVIRLTSLVSAAYGRTDVALYTIALPEQSFAGGVVRMRVIEGYITTARAVAAPSGPAPDLTRGLAQAVVGKPPLTKSTLQRSVGLIRDIPGAQPDFKFLGGGAPGALQLVVTPNIRRFETSFAFNNRGASMLGRNQIEMTSSVNSLFREGERTSLTLAFPTEFRRFQFVGVSQREPLGASGASVTANVGYLRTKPKIRGFDLTGSAQTGGLAFAYPVIRSDTRNLTVTADFDALNSDNALFGRSISEERTRAIRVAASYSKLAAKSAMSAGATISHGLNGLGAREAGPLGTAIDFTKVNLTFSRVDVRGPLILRLSAAAQLTSDLLPSSEQFSIGGSQYGRAYAAAVASGDRGYAGSVELAFKRIKPGAKLAGSEVYAFADYGRVIQTHGSLLPGEHVNCAGLGLRLAATKRTMVELEGAKAFSALRQEAKARPFRLMLSLRSTI